MNKILLLCYVIPLNPTPISSINLSLISSLDLLTIQPVTSLVRRFGMSATSLESYQIKMIQQKYYQNSLLHVTRQDNVNKPTSTTRRKRKREKNKQQQLNVSEETKNELNNNQEANHINHINRNEFGNGNERRKVSKRSIHWNALSNETYDINESSQISNKVIHPNHTQQQQSQEQQPQEQLEEENDETKEGNNTFFGWLLSFFRS